MWAVRWYIHLLLIQPLCLIFTLYNWELEDGSLSCNLLVHRGVSVQLVFDVLLVLGVQLTGEETINTCPPRKKEK